MTTKTYDPSKVKVTINGVPLTTIDDFEAEMENKPPPRAVFSLPMSLKTPYRSGIKIRFCHLCRFRFVRPTRQSKDDHLCQNIWECPLCKLRVIETTYAASYRDGTPKEID